jgi:hypothetical protein
MMIDLGEAQVFEGQVAQALDSRLDADCSGANLFEQAAQMILIHLSSSRHHDAKDVIDAGGVAGAVFLKPFEHVGIQTHGHQFLGRTPELGELLIGKRRNIRIVDLGIVSAFLPPGNAL